MSEQRAASRVQRWEEQVRDLCSGAVSTWLLVEGERTIAIAHQVVGTLWTIEVMARADAHERAIDFRGNADEACGFTEAVVGWCESRVNRALPLAQDASGEAVAIQTNDATHETARAITGHTGHGRGIHE